MTLRIQGYAAIFGLVDRAGDVIRAGAFGAAMPVPLLWQHHGAPVGEIAAIGDDPRGLWIDAVVTDAAVAALVRQGALRGLSVGYRTIEARQGGYREIVHARLAEISLVAVPMQAAARVETIL